MSDLPVGRELDVLVAEKVMGWKNLVWREAQVQPPGAYSYQTWSPSGFYGEGPGHECYLAKSYSTSIAAAWDVVEKFRRGIGVGHVAACVEILITDEDSMDCYCSIFGPSIAKVQAQADTAPLAICRAALKAVEAS